MLVRWNHPFLEAQRQNQNQMSRLLSEGFGSRGPEEEVAAAWAPPVDIVETPETLNFIVELPGFKNEDLTLRVENGVLTLEGERKFEAESNERNYHRVERSYGKFVRGFTLPSNMNQEKIHANLTDGVLFIALSKKEETKPKKIQIGAGVPKNVAVRRVA